MVENTTDSLTQHAPTTRDGKVTPTPPQSRDDGEERRRDPRNVRKYSLLVWSHRSVEKCRQGEYPTVETQDRVKTRVNHHRHHRYHRSTKPSFMSVYVYSEIFPRYPCRLYCSEDGSLGTCSTGCLVKWTGHWRRFTSESNGWTFWTLRLW